MKRRKFLAAVGAGAAAAAATTIAKPALRSLCRRSSGVDVAGRNRSTRCWRLETLAKYVRKRPMENSN
jgi:hypothetical protein